MIVQKIAKQNSLSQYNLTYRETHSRSDEYYDWLGVEIPEKLYTILLLLGVNWHIEKSEGAVGEVSRTD